MTKPHLQKLYMLPASEDAIHRPIIKVIDPPSPAFPHVKKPTLWIGYEGGMCFATITGRRNLTSLMQRLQRALKKRDAFDPRP